MRFDVLTLFPDLFSGYLSQSILKKAIDRQLVDVRLWNYRDWATGNHKSVDDKPFGGGPGMLICCQPVFDCVDAVQAEGDQPGRLVMLTPQGRRLDQKLVQELAQENRLVLLCGRYEGFDERIRIGLNPLEISVGDFIVNGGEVPAMLIIDAVLRLIPDVLGDQTSHRYESFAESGHLEYPQYTRPRVYRGMSVPEVLLSGDHRRIAQWQAEQSEQRTRERRADLLAQPAEDSRAHRATQKGHNDG